MTSKAERRRHKRAKSALPELAPIERKEQHRVGGRFAKEEDPQKTALEARQRRFGTHDTQKAKDAAQSAYLGAEIGYLIQSECKPDEAARLWDVWQAYGAAERTYRIRYIGTTGEPQGAAIQMVPEQVQADPSMRVDLREPEERDRQAVANWMRWQGLLGQIDKASASALRQAERGSGRCLWRDGAPTASGRFALAALRELARVATER